MDMQVNKLYKKIGIGIVSLCGVGFLVMAGWNQFEDYQKAPMRHAIEESNREKEQAHIADRARMRDQGVVKAQQEINAFNEVTGTIYNVMGVKEQSYFKIRMEGATPVSVCFSAYPSDENKRLFAPLVTTYIEVKFDGDKTKVFDAERGSGGTDLCVTSVKRFIFNMKAAKRMQVALPFLDGSTHVREIYEYNLGQINKVDL